MAAAVLESDDLQLVAAVARTCAGRSVADALGCEQGADVEITADPVRALAQTPDVWIDYTHPSAVEAHVLAAVGAGCGVVIGTSGLTAENYATIGQAARAGGAGVVAAGNFSLTAALLKHLAGVAAAHLPRREIVDYAHAGKPDAPSGTALELAEFLGTVAPNQLEMAVADTLGARDARGATIAGTQVHSLRLPSYTISVEAIFGLPDERLTIRHDAGTSALPYVAGTLLAVRRVGQITGLVRGLDTLLFGQTEAERHPRSAGSS